MNTISTTVTNLVPLSPSVKLIRLFCGKNPFVFKPGQWISVQNGTDTAEVAAYSISSTPNDENQIDIAVKHIPEINISKYLHNQLKVGDALNISPAQGEIVLPNNVTGPVAFIAGGTGVAPLIAMARELIENNFRENITFMVSAPSLNECIFNQELQQLQRARSNFQFIFISTRDKSSQARHHGRINQSMLAPLAKQHRCFYLCGPPRMVDHVNFLLIQSGVDPDRIIFDRWW